MNREAIAFNLSQAKEEIDKIIAKSAVGEFDEAGSYVMGQRFAIVMNYICNAWYHRDLTSAEIESLAQSDYERYSTLIPNFCFQFKMDDGFSVVATPSVKAES